MLAAKISVEASERKAQIARLNAQFQSAATFALSDGNLAAYAYIERLVIQWFKVQYASLGPLPPTRRADSFHLLDGATGTLIQLMKDNKIALAREFKAPEGSEILVTPPPTPNMDKT